MTKKSDERQTFLIIWPLDSGEIQERVRSFILKKGGKVTCDEIRTMLGYSTLVAFQECTVERLGQLKIFGRKEMYFRLVGDIVSLAE